MGGAEGITTHLLQLADAVVLNGVRQGGADAGVVLVIAGALDLDVLAVEENPLLRVDGDGAYAEGGLVAVHGRLVGAEFSDELVEIALFQRPELGAPHGQLLFVDLI